MDKSLASIDVVSTRPFLMGELVDFVLFFLSLDSFDVGKHVTGSKILGELFGLKSVQVETSEGDELPGVSESTKISTESSDLIVRHVEGGPVEGGGEVVSQQLGGVVLLHEGGEFSSNVQSRSGGFHPDHIGVSEVLFGTGSTQFNGAIDGVETFG